MQYFLNTYFCSLEGTVVKILSSERRLVSRQQIPLEQDTAVICVRNNMKLHKKIAKKCHSRIHFKISCQ